MLENQLGFKVKMANGIGYLDHRDKRGLKTLITLAEGLFSDNKDVESVCIYDQTGDALFYLKWLDRDAGKFRKEQIIK